MIFNEIPSASSTTPLSKSAHSHACPRTDLSDIKTKQKTGIVSGEWVRDRDNYISAMHSTSVRSTTKNTDAIFTAYVIEQWRSRGGVCVNAESDARVRRNGGGIFRWKCFEFRHDDIRAQSLSWFCRIERFGSRARVCAESDPACSAGSASRAARAECWARRVLRKSMLKVGVSKNFRRRKLKRWSVDCKSPGTVCDVRAAALGKLSADEPRPEAPDAPDASAHALQLQTMTSTMGKYAAYYHQLLFGYSTHSYAESSVRANLWTLPSWLRGGNLIHAKLQTQYIFAMTKLNWWST